MPRVLLVPLQTADGKKDADETTREEFEDNMYHIISKWNAATKNQVYWLSFDNNNIQATANLRHLPDPNHPDKCATLHPNGFSPKLPPYSHDLNRPIEHLFGSAKHTIKCELFKCWDKYYNAHELQGLVHKVFNNLSDYGLGNHVRGDVAGLPLLWQIISTPAGVHFLDSENRAHVGTGGDYPNAIAR